MVAVTYSRRLNRARGWENIRTLLHDDNADDDDDDDDDEDHEDVDGSGDSPLCRSIEEDTRLKRMTIMKISNIFLLWLFFIVINTNQRISMAFKLLTYWLWVHNMRKDKQV